MFDASVSGLDIGSFEGRFANYEGVDYDSQRPGIHFIGMPALALQNFRSNVVGCATNSALFLSVVVELRSQAEVAQFDLHLVVEEQVSQLQVPVDDPVRVQVLQSCDYLQRVTLYFKFMEPFTALEEFVHALVLT